MIGNLFIYALRSKREQSDSETLNKLDNDGRFIRLDYETIIKWLEVVPAIKARLCYIYRRAGKIYTNK